MEQKQTFFDFAAEVGLTKHRGVCGQHKISLSSVTSAKADTYWTWGAEPG